jgi:protein SCO1
VQTAFFIDMNKKTLYLLLALAVPGLIFVFLKFFGKNKFDVPVYYQNGMEQDSVCQMFVQGQYKIADSVLIQAGAQPNQVTVLAVYPFVKDDLRELHRIAAKYTSDNVFMGIVSGMQNLPKSHLPVQEVSYASFGWLVTCALRMQEPWSVVLIDNHKQIRGYYDGSRRDEMDRLDLELSIVLNKY